MEYIKLTVAATSQGTELKRPVDFIRLSEEKGNTIIHFTNGELLTVKESLDDVKSLIKTGKSISDNKIPKDNSWLSLLP